MQDESASKWLLGSIISLATIVSGIVWWAAQSDAAIKINSGNLVRMDTRIEEILKRLDTIGERILKIEVKSDTRDDRMFERLDQLSRQLGRVDDRTDTKD